MPPSQARVALVTAAADGLARGIVVRLAAAGFRVTFTTRPGGTPPDATLALVRAHDPDAVAIPADAADPAAAQRVIDAMGAARGAPDILVHAAGPIVVRRFARSTLEDYRAMVDGNLQSAVTHAFAALPAMRARGFGRLVFFAANGSGSTTPGVGMSLYLAAKAGVVALARTLALEEAAAGITTNVVEPGDIRDKHADRAAAAKIVASNPTGHAGSWQDVADAVAFLVSDRAGFVNGAVLPVSGGLIGPYETGMAK